MFQALCSAPVQAVRVSGPVQGRAIHVSGSLCSAGQFVFQALCSGQCSAVHISGSLQCRAVRGASTVPIRGAEPGGGSWGCLWPSPCGNALLHMFCSGAALQVRLWAPGAATRAPGSLCSPAVSWQAPLGLCLLDGAAQELCPALFWCLHPEHWLSFLMRN